MKIKEIREMSAEQLAEKLMELKKDLFNLRLQHATNQLENPGKIADVKKDIAKIKTVQRERELAAKYGVDMPQKELETKAEAFALGRGTRSARCAEQFVESLL